MAADTIFAPATARGRAAVAIVRLSGPDSDRALAALGADGLAARRASLRWLHSPDSGEPLDEALVLRFEKGASFTGEASAELHLHGGTAILAAVLDALSTLQGVRLAEPGEFARRALEGGRLSLLEVEALADLVNAETEAQRRLATRARRGALGAQAERWRSALVRARAMAEAVLDFSDDDVPETVSPEVTALVAEVSEGVSSMLSGAKAAERLRDGFEVALLGPPNAGKSSLLNALAKRDAALTSSVAGTTRDVIEVRMDLAGLPVTILDTAGLRETDDPLEAAGIARARVRADSADMRVWLCSSDDPSAPEGALREGDILVASKADLGAGVGLPVSTVTGEGVDDLIDAVVAALEQRAAGASAAMRVRHRLALEDASTRLEAAAAWLSRGDDSMELVAEELREATRALEAVMGRVDVEIVLDDIFASFCLGK